MHVLVFYVPGTHLEQVKEELFRQGAGALGNYSRCSWQVSGQGQFQPEPDSTPFLGRVGKLEQVSEYRVEMVCPDDKIVQVAESLLRSHPYEEPAYHFIPVLTAEDL